MLIGNLTSAGASPALMAVGTKRASRYVLPFGGRIAKLSVLADTAGAAGPVRVRGVVYDAVTLRLIAAGDEVVVPAGLPEGWLDLPFEVGFPAGVPVGASDIRIGVIVGDDGLSVYEEPAPINTSSGGVVTAGSFYGQAVYGVDTYGQSVNGFLNADPYGTGPSDPFGVAAPETELVVYATLFDAWVPPNAPEVLYARLPWPESQQVFSSTGPRATTATAASLSWHGTRLDPERGAFCVAQTGGKFDQYLGERLMLETRGAGARRVAYVFVHNLIDGLDTDLSVPRRPWAELAVLGLDGLTVTATVMS